MPLKKRDLEREIKAAGCSIEMTKKGHFIVLDPDGNPIEGYAVRHPGNYVLDKYVSKVRKALKKVQKDEQGQD